MIYRFRNPDALEIAGAYSLYAMFGSCFRKCRVATPYAERRAWLYYAELVRETRSGKPNYDPLTRMDEQCDRALHKSIFQVIPEESLKDLNAVVSFIPEGSSYRLRFAAGRNQVFEIRYSVRERRCDFRCFNADDVCRGRKLPQAGELR